MSYEQTAGPTPSPRIEGNAEVDDRVRNLLAALQSSRLIGQAQGLLMAERRCAPKDAFDELVHLSQHQNVRLRQVAANLVHDATERIQPAR